MCEVRFVVYNLVYHLVYIIVDFSAWLRLIVCCGSGLVIVLQRVCDRFLFKTPWFLTMILRSLFCGKKLIV